MPAKAGITTLPLFRQFLTYEARMLNRDVFTTDPAEYPLANEGVAKLSFPVPADQLNVVRAELASFVCEGAYADGLTRIIERFCAAHASGTDIPGVWISGFFGSGKSHLATMLGVSTPVGSQASGAE
jgi:hypothetical protein